MFEERIVVQNLIEACPVGEKLKDVADTDALTANARAAPTFAFFHGDSFESVGPHIQILSVLKIRLYTRSGKSRYGPPGAVKGAHGAFIGAKRRPLTARRLRTLVGEGKPHVSLKS